MTVRCKMKLSEVRHVDWSQTARVYVFQAVYDDGTPENARFCKATPSGRFEMTVDNPAVHEEYKLGQSYYFDMIPAQK